MNGRGGEDLWSALDDVVGREDIGSVAEFESGYGHDEQADDRGLQQQKREGEFIVAEQLQVAHREQQKLLQRVSTLPGSALPGDLVSIAVVYLPADCVRGFDYILRVVFGSLKSSFCLLR